MLALSGTISILLISLGWSYAWHWFATWDVPFVALGLGLDTLLEYGRIVVQHFWWLTCLWLAATIASILFAYTHAEGNKALAGAMLVAFLVPWFFSHEISERAVKAHVKLLHTNRYSGWPEAQVLLRPDLSIALPDHVKSKLSTGSDLCYRLLFKASNGLWLIRMNKEGHPGTCRGMSSVGVM